MFLIFFTPAPSFCLFCFVSLVSVRWVSITVTRFWQIPITLQRQWHSPYTHELGLLLMLLRTHQSRYVVVVLPFGFRVCVWLFRIWGLHFGLCFGFWRRFVWFGCGFCICFTHLSHADHPATLHTRHFQLHRWPKSNQTVWRKLERWWYRMWTRSQLSGSTKRHSRKIN